MDANWAAVWVAVGAGVISLGSVVVGIVAVAYSKGQRDSTKRQADAAEAQVEYMRRQVELMEQEAKGRAVRQADPASEWDTVAEALSAASASISAGSRLRVPPWSTAHSRGDTYSLINGSNEPVYDVVVELPADTIHRGPYRWDRIDPRATVTFLVAFSLASRGRDLVVRWKWEPDGPEQTWTSEIPPKT